jgi:hypothetical protein
LSEAGIEIQDIEKDYLTWIIHSNHEI